MTLAPDLEPPLADSPPPVAELASSGLAAEALCADVSPAVPPPNGALVPKTPAEDLEDLAELVRHGAGHSNRELEGAIAAAKAELNSAPASAPASPPLASPEVAARDSARRRLRWAGARPRGFLPVLKNVNFLTLWSGQVFSQLADKVFLVMAIALIDQHFQRPNEPISGWVSAVMIAFTIPAVLFGSLAGVYVDRLPKKTVLVATNLIRGGLVLALPSLLWVGQLSPRWSEPLGMPLGFALLLAVTFAVSTLTQFFAPAEQAVMPLIVKKRDLLSANSLYTTTMMASVVVGFAVGEPLLALANGIVTRFGGSADLGQELAVGGSYVIAGLLLLAMRTGETRDRSDLERPHVLADLRDGLRYLGENPLVRSALIQLTILFSIFAALAVLAVRLAELIPELKASQFGVLLAAGGAGMGLGALALGQFGGRFANARLALFGSLGMGAALAALSLLADHLWGSLLAILSLGMAAALVGIPMQTAIQKETPETMRGKVFGLQNNAVNIALSLPLALAGVAESWLGLPTVFLGLAGLAIAGGVVNAYVQGRSSSQESDSF